MESSSHSGDSVRSSRDRSRESSSHSGDSVSSRVEVRSVAYIGERVLGAVQIGVRRVAHTMETE